MITKQQYLNYVELHNKNKEHIKKILNVFIDFFGAQYVECKKQSAEILIKNGIFNFIRDNKSLSSDYEAVYTNIAKQYHAYEIIIHYPKVTITNENDMEHEIKDLFLQVCITYNGNISGSFSMKRSTYSYAEFASDYMHSHAAGIFKTFGSTCLGKGPIRNTCARLLTDNNLIIWQLFCLELDKYVKTESMNGGPHRKMAQITVSNIKKMGVRVESKKFTDISPSHIQLTLLTQFLPDLLAAKIFPFVINNGTYQIAMSYDDIIIKISVLWINWLNTHYKKTPQTCITENLLWEVKLKNNNILYQVLPEEAPKIIPTVKIITFKNKDYFFKVEDKILELEETDNIYIMNPSLVTYICTMILKILNIEYGNNINPLFSNGISQKKCLLHFGYN